MPKRRTFGHFLASSENNFFDRKGRRMVTQVEGHFRRSADVINLLDQFRKMTGSWVGTTEQSLD